MPTRLVQKANVRLIQMFGEEVNILNKDICMIEEARLARSRHMRIHGSSHGRLG